MMLSFINQGLNGIRDGILFQGKTMTARAFYAQIKPFMVPWFCLPPSAVVFLLPI